MQRSLFSFTLCLTHCVCKLEAFDSYVPSVRTNFKCINCCLAIILHNLQLSFSLHSFRSIYSNKYSARSSSFICDSIHVNFYVVYRQARSILRQQKHILLQIARKKRFFFTQKSIEKAEANRFIRIFSISFKFKIDEHKQKTKG